MARAVAEAAAGVPDPGLVLFFPAGLARAAGRDAADAAPGCRVAGMTASAAMTEAGALLEGCSALAFDRSLPTGLAVREHASGDLATAAYAATKAALASVPVELESRLVLLFADTRSGDQARIVAGAYRAAGPAVPLAGGGAAGTDPMQFADGRELRDSLVAVAIGSDRPIGVGLADGCRTIGPPAIVTRSEGRTVLELDGRPAADVYAERLAGGREVGAGEFAFFAALHPLAQPELSGDRRLRHVLERTDQGGLVCATTLPDNAAVEFTRQDPERIVRSAWDAVSVALAPLGGEPAQAALAFDCAGRKAALGPDLGREVDAIRSSFGGAPALAGCYTRGEIGRARGAKGDRNHALVVVAIG